MSFEAQPGWIAPLEEVTDYFEKHPPGVLYSSEPVGVQFLICEVVSAFARLAGPPRRSPGQEAEKFFVALWCDDWKNRLCKCRFRGCGLYFSA